MFKSIISNHHRKIVIMLFMVLMSMVMIAPQAQLENTDPNGSYQGETTSDKVVETSSLKSFDIGGGLISATNKIQQAFKAVRENGKAIARNAGIKRLSVSLFWIFGVVALVIPGTKMVFGGGDSAIEEFFSTILSIGFFTAIGLVKYELVVDGVLNMLEGLSKEIMNGTADPILNLGNIIKAMLDGLQQNTPLSISVIIGNFGYFLVNILMMLIAIFFAIVALFFILIYLNIGNALIAIAYALGPIFIACGVWSVTKPFFDKWLNFLLIAGMYQVVSSLIVVLIAQAGIIPGYKDPSIFVAAANVVYAVMMMVTLAFLSSMIPEIVNALMPGSIGGMSKAGAGASKNVTQLMKPKSDSGGNNPGGKK